MTWLALHAEIAAEFGALAGEREDIYDTGRKLESQVRRSDPAAWAHEYAQEKRRRRVKRAARAAARPPCPHCGGKVERVGATAKIPTYCAPACSRAARFKRWWEKHGEARNARRRKGPRS